MDDNVTRRLAAFAKTEPRDIGALGDMLEHACRQADSAFAHMPSVSMRQNGSAKLRADKSEQCAQISDSIISIPEAVKK